MADELEDRADRVIPNFHYKAVKNNYRSKQEGRPVYENREYIEMIVPGNATERPCMPVREEHKERFPDAYRRFKEKQEQQIDGTPLEQWPVMDPARVSSLKDVDIYTVDQVANLPDSFASSVGPDFNELKKQAQRFLSVAESTANEERLESMEAELQRLREENEELRQNQKKKPGRKKKVAASSEAA